MLHLKIVMNAGAEKVPVMMLANGPQSNRFPFLSVFSFSLSFLLALLVKQSQQGAWLVGMRISSRRRRPLARPFFMRHHAGFAFCQTASTFFHIFFS
jgi:hypothetical protein